MVGAAGPRVGGAHVAVNMKFDGKSLNAVGERIAQKFAQIGARNGKVYRELGAGAVTAWRSLLGSVLAGAPHMGAAISAVAGAATMLAGALREAVIASGGLIGIGTSLGLAMVTLSIGFNQVGAALAEIDPKKLKQELAAMAPAARTFTLGLREMKKELQDKVADHLFAGLQPEMKMLSEKFLPAVTNGFLKMADSLNGVFKEVSRYLGSTAGVEQTNQLFAGSAKIFSHLGKAVVPFLDGFLRLINALTPASVRLADKIAEIGRSFQEWTKGATFAKDVDDRMKRAETTAGKLFKIFGDLYAALSNIFNAANPATNTFLDMIGNATQRFQDFTASADGKNKIAEWAMNSVDVMRQFGKTIEAVFKVIAELADPRLIISFLKTVENAFNILADLPLDKMVSKFADLAEAFQPISGPMLAIIASGAALNIILGNLIGQVGGLFTVLAGVGGKGPGGGLLAFLEKIGGSAGKHAKEMTKLESIFGGLFRVLGRAVKFAGLAGIAVYVGIIISKSDKLKKKVGDVFKSMKDAFGNLTDGFKEVGTAAGPLLKTLDPVFKIMDKIAEVIIGLALDTIIYAFQSLGNVFKGVSRILAGFLTFINGVLHLDFGMMWDGLKKMASGLWPLLKGIFGLFVTFFAPAKLAKIGMGLMRGLLRGVGKAIPGLLAAIGRLIVRMLLFFVKLQPRLAFYAFKGFMAVLKAIRGAGPKIASGAKGVLESIVRFFMRLPGRLFDLGRSAFGKLGTAIRNALPKIKSTAGSIFKGIWDAVSKLPGQLFDLGVSMISKLIGGIVSKIGDLGSAMGKIGGKIGKFLPGSPVREGPLKEWNYGGDATGGGRKVVDALAKGLGNVSPIDRAMRDVSAAMDAALATPVGRGRGQAGEPSNGSGAGMPRRMILRVGDREFDAYVEEIADSRIDAADNLAWQGD